MKFLRILYMTIGWIVMIPAAVIVYMSLFIFMCIKTRNAKRASRTCWNLLRASVEMNLDFIEHGLFGA